MPTSLRSSLALVIPQFAPRFVAAFTDESIGRIVRLPALERLAAYATPVPSTPQSPDLEVWQSELLHALNLGDGLYPSAPLTFRGACRGASSGNQVERGTWLHAEPVVHTISSHGLTMTAATPWTDATLATVGSLVREHLADSQINWRVANGKAYLQTATSLDVQTVSMQHAARGELQEAQPTGRDAQVLRRAMTDLQMLVHEKLNYPNAPNAIWLWGAGSMPQLLPKELPPMWTNDDYTRGIYRAHSASERCSELSTFDAVLATPCSRRIAVVCDGSPEALEQNWFAPALRALDKGHVQAVDVYLDGWQLHARRSLLRRLFARPRPLSEWMN